MMFSPYAWIFAVCAVVSMLCTVAQTILAYQRL